MTENADQQDERTSRVLIACAIIAAVAFAVGIPWAIIQNVLIPAGVFPG